jgi:prepilin-type N-terminal cleavage/methylation domain-containing protein
MKRHSLKKDGFTLIEILITTVLVFILFMLIYAVFFSVTNVTADLQKRMKSSEITFKFLDKFSREMKCMIFDDEDQPVLEEKYISFLTSEQGAPYPVRITYFIENAPDNLEALVRKQENLLNGYYFTLPVLENCDRISFLFYSGAAWNYYAAEPEKVTGIAVETEEGGETTFFPVKLYRGTEEEDDENEKK